MKLELSQKQRIIVASIYLIILAAIFNLIGGNFKSLVWDGSLDSSIWFYAGAFLIILGSYIVEPYFAKPSDVIVNSFAALLALLGLSNKTELIGYTFIFWYAIILLILSILTIFLKDHSVSLSKVIFWIVECFGRSKVIFSLVYLSATYSYFAKPDTIVAFVSILAFWVCIIFFDIVGLIISKISGFINLFRKNKSIINELGQAIGCENPMIYKVEIDYLKHKIQSVKYGDIVAIETNPGVGLIGIIINKKQLLTKQWLSIFLLRNEENVLKISLKEHKTVPDSKSIFTEENYAYLINIESLEENLRKMIEENELYKNKERFIGYVTVGSNINSINFTILRNLDESEQKVHEGTILKTSIYGKETLYQVINGSTKEEHLEKFDKYGYIVGQARKLGQYDYDKKELNISKWVPSMYAPLFFGFSNYVSKDRLAEIANNSIGRLPDTDLEIPIKDIDSIVTHNVAILGILGIGKSCLAYELIKKVTDNGIKAICIDITNEYYSDKGLLSYISPEALIYELDEKVRDDLKKDKVRSGSKGNPSEWGNEEKYVKELDEAIKAFIESDKKVLILNPDWHPVAKAMSKFNIESTIDLTVAEKTRLISERLFLYAMKAGQSETAKYLLVYEEAHSLVPEWNSVVNEGDKNATNGTAKVILQGRKYGLGCLVITQRTANVSKSILNQCNTIFALRVFDDTGKGFLENYIGQDYSYTLPTLEERHVIAIGKGLKLKQPVIIQLNDKSLLTI